MEDKMPNQEGRKFINLSKPVSESYKNYNESNGDREIYPQNNYNSSQNSQFNPNAYQQEIYPQNNNEFNPSKYQQQTYSQSSSNIYKEASIPNSSFEIPKVQPSVVNPPIPATNYNNPQQNMQTNTKFCKYCGQKIHSDAVVCTHCGRQVEQLQSGTVSSNNVYINNISPGTQQLVPVSPYSKTSALLLACLGFIGVGGIHRLYTGRYASGILYFITGGLCGFGTVLDIIKIASGKFHDKNGLILKD